MEVNELDALSKSLQSISSNAQKNLETRQTNRLRNLINVDSSGEPEFISWECMLPAGDGSERNHELLRIPLASLYQSEDVVISELSIEFDCRIEKTKSASVNVKNAYKIVPTRTKPDKHNKNHSLKTMSCAANNYQPVTAIDNIPIDDYFDCIETDASPRKNWYRLENTTTRRVYLVVILVTFDLMLMFL